MQPNTNATFRQSRYPWGQMFAEAVLVASLKFEGMRGHPGPVTSGLRHSRALSARGSGHKKPNTVVNELRLRILGCNDMIINSLSRSVHSVLRHPPSGAV